MTTPSGDPLYVENHNLDDQERFLQRLVNGPRESPEENQLVVTASQALALLGVYRARFHKVAAAARPLAIGGESLGRVGDGAEGFLRELLLLCHKHKVELITTEDDGIILSDITNPDPDNELCRFDVSHETHADGEKLVLRYRRDVAGERFYDVFDVPAPEEDLVGRARMKPPMLLCGAVPLREEVAAPKTLPRERRTSHAALLALCRVLGWRGQRVPLAVLRQWSRTEQAEAYLWAVGEGPLPTVLDPDGRKLARQLGELGMFVAPGEVAGWSPGERREALRWAEAFTRGREDLPAPEHVYDAAHSY